MRIQVSSVAVAAWLFGVALHAQGTPAGLGTLHISAALQTATLDVKPIAFTRFLVLHARGDTTVVGTGRDGNATTQLPPGGYTIVPAQPVELEGKSYRWALAVQIVVGQPQTVELTNLNATTTPISSSSVERAAGRVAPEAVLFRRVASGIVLVEAGLGHGSGFIIDSLDGVILTNAHVVGTAEDGDVSVILDSTTRVPARILARDNDADIAVLRVAPSFLVGRTRLPLHPSTGEEVVPGERLVAFGFPLSQGLTMTSGIASSVREGAIISDVNINPGNSGGPLLNMDGVVVAVNTFGDAAQRGPGVSGSIRVAKAGQALARAASAALEAREERLPMMPRDVMSASALRASASAIDARQYPLYRQYDVNTRFELTVQTPQATFVSMATYDKEVAKDRRKREQRAQLSSDEQYSELKEVRDWIAYVGNYTTPVVSIVVNPSIGETTGSAIGSVLGALGGVRTKGTYKFKGDVRGVSLFRGAQAEEVPSLRGGHAPVSVWQENQWIQLKDVADLGYYVYDPEAFRPAPDGTPPLLVVGVRDLKNPTKLSCRILPKDLVAQTWNDFEDYYKERRGNMIFRPADRRMRVDESLARRALASRCDF